MTDDEIDTAWSKSIGGLATDALIMAKVIAKDDYARASTVIAEEIYARLAVRDRPDRTNWRYDSN